MFSRCKKSVNVISGEQSDTIRILCKKSFFLFNNPNFIFSVYSVFENSVHTNKETLRHFHYLTDCQGKPERLTPFL